MVCRIFLGRLAAALLGAAAVALSHAQAPQQPTTEAQARYWIYGAFLTQAVPDIIGERVTLGPELEQRLGVTAGADRSRIYGALMSYTDGKPLNVRKATAEEIARYQPQAKRELKDPVFAVRAGEIALLVEYDLQTNTIPFVGQLGVASQPPTAAPRATPAPVPSTAVPSATPVSPVATIAPKSAPARVPPPPPLEVLKPNGPCVVKPVMSEQDLANCRATPSASARVQSASAPAVVQPQARAVPPPPPLPQRAAPCEVKPVMTEEDLANCRNAPGGSARVEPGPPFVAKSQARVEPAPQPQRAAVCEVKPVMTEEDLANCRNVPGGAARVQPGPPVVLKPQPRVEAPQPRRRASCEIKPVMTEEDLANCRAIGEAKAINPGPPVVVKPQARVTPAPASAPSRAARCEVKPVMSEEDLANCRAAPGGSARIDPGAPATSRPAAAAPPPAPKPAATPCVIKPVMSEEDLIACGIRR